MLEENSTSAKYKKKPIRSDKKIDVKGKKNKMLPREMPIRNRNHCGLNNQNPKTASKIKTKKKYTVFWNLLLIAVIKVRICQDNELKHNITYLIIVCHNQPCLFKRAAIAMDPAIFKALTMMRLDDLKCTHSIRNAYVECGLSCTYCVDERVLAICAILFFSPFSIRHHLPI